MAKPERLEDLGKIALIFEQIFNSHLMKVFEFSSDEFIEIYADPDEREQLYTDLNWVIRQLDRIDDIIEGDKECY